jgi:hypothetical protein
MVTVRFNKFVDRVCDETKKQTIRNRNSYPNLKVGSKIHCYSTKKVPEFNRPVLDRLLYVGRVIEIICVNWGSIKNSEDIAKKDGFRDSGEMREYFRNLSDFAELKIIRWI